MDPTALSKVLSGDRKMTSLELALICTATHTDVLSILGADPMHGPSYRRGYTEATLHARRELDRGTDMREWLYGPAADMRDGDYTGCGAEKDGHFCDLPPHGWPQTHHAEIFWESPSTSPEQDEQR